MWVLIGSCTSESEVRQQREMRPMAWSEKQLPWMLSEILQQAPAASAVYTVWRHDIPVYVGETDDLQRRLIEHFRGNNACITREHPTSFAFQLVEAAARHARHELLVREMRPICNAES
jgi:predicted GIY-YIG superfamily endonuclease